MNAPMREPVREDAGQDLVTIPADRAMAVFSSVDGIDPFLAIVRKRIDAFVGDVTTASGRKEIAAMAYAVARSKTALEEAGKKVAAEAKELPKKIDASRKRMKDTLDEWRDEVRAPLTAWEKAEEARLAKHADAIESMNLAARINPDWSAAELHALLEEVQAIDVGPACEEFEAEYARAKVAALEALTGAIAKRETYEAEQAELTELRRLAAERAARDREDEIRREAAERARTEAAAEADRARIESERAAAAEIARVEASARAEREAAERRDQEHAAALAAAERRAQEAAEEADRAIARKRQQEADELAARESDREHRAAINRAAFAAFVEGGLDADSSRLAITLIATKKIPAISIAY